MTTTITISALTPVSPIQDAYYFPAEYSTGYTSITGHVTAADFKNYISSSTLATINVTEGTIGVLSAGSISSGPITSGSLAITGTLSTGGPGDTTIGGNLVVDGSTTFYNPITVNPAATWNKATFITTSVPSNARLGADASGIVVSTNANYNPTATTWAADSTATKAFAYIQDIPNGRHEFRIAPTSALSPTINWTLGASIDENGIQTKAIGSVTPGTGTFTTLYAQSATITNNTISNSTGTGALVVSGGVGIQGALYVQSMNAGSGAIATTGATSTGTLTANAGTASTSTSTGTAIITGGVGVSGNVYAGAVYDNATRVVSSVTATAGGGISISGATTSGPSAAFTITNTGVLSITGTANQITANVATGNILLSLPQSINSTATPTFSNVTLANGVTTGGPVYVGGYSQIPSYSSMMGIKFPGGGTQYGLSLQPATDTTNVLSVFNAAGTYLGGINETSSAITFSGAGSFSSVSVSGSIVPTSGNAVNLGSSTNWFATVYGQSTQAQYADLAEKYESDSDYEPGTVLVFGEETEVTTSTTANDSRVAGVVSTLPAHLMNSGLTDGVALALTGRVPCKVTGVVKRGDMMVTSEIPGVAMTNNSPSIGTVIGKALGNYSSDGVGVVEVVVGRY